MRTERIPEGRGVEGAVLATTMTVTTARVRRTRSAEKRYPGKGWVQRMGTGK
jgi:hypothetical protein